MSKEEDDKKVLEELNKRKEKAAKDPTSQPVGNIDQPVYRDKWGRKRKNPRKVKPGGEVKIKNSLTTPKEVIEYIKEHPEKTYVRNRSSAFPAINEQSIYQCSEI